MRWNQVFRGGWQHETALRGGAPVQTGSPLRMRGTEDGVRVTTNVSGPGSGFCLSPEAAHNRRLEMWSRMGCPFLVGHNWRWTRRWCAPCIVMGRPTQKSSRHGRSGAPKGQGAQRTASTRSGGERKSDTLVVLGHRGRREVVTRCNLLSPSWPILTKAREQPFLLQRRIRASVADVVRWLSSRVVAAKAVATCLLRARGRWAHYSGMGGRDGSLARGVGAMSE